MHYEMSKKAMRVLESISKYDEALFAGVANALTSLEDVIEAVPVTGTYTVNLRDTKVVAQVIVKAEGDYVYAHVANLVWNP